MASQAVSLIQDQNSTAHYGGVSVAGKDNNFKASKKRGLGARKPLGDLSNSVKPVIPTQGSKSKNIFSFTENNRLNVSKIKTESSKSLDKVQNGGRKALSNISNSMKAQLPEAPKKNQKAKVGIVADEPPIHPGCIAEEGFLHNHQECIESQIQATDMIDFLKTIGLDHGFSNRLVSPWAPPAVCSTMKHGTPTKKFDLEEIDEEMLSFDYDPSCKTRVLSPPCKTPMSTNIDMLWKDHDFNFKLMASP